MEIFVISCDGYIWERAYTSLNDAKQELESRGFFIDFNSLDTNNYVRTTKYKDGITYTNYAKIKRVYL